jgi:amino acid transporter
MFLILGNLSGNAVAFGIYTAIAVGRDPIYDKDNNYNKGLVVGLAIMTLSISAVLHIFTRRGGVLMHNIIGVINVSIFLVLAVLGVAHAGGEYLQASRINEPAIPLLTEGNFSITVAQINNASNTDFRDFFAERHDLGGYVESFLFALFSYTGFEQPFYVLSEVPRPRKVFPKYVLLGMVMAAIYTLGNVSYFCVFPQRVYATGPANSLNMAGAFLHYLFDNSYGPQMAERVMAALIAVYVFGNILVMTFIAVRVKKEIAKEGVLPHSLFFTFGHTTLWTRLKNCLRSTQRLQPNWIRNGIGLDDHLDKSPMAALALYWSISIFLVLITMPLKPTTQYSFLIALYSYFDLYILGFLVSAGLLYLKLDSFRKEKGRNWPPKATFMPWLSTLHAVVYFFATSIFLSASFISPNSGSAYRANIQSYAWFVVPTIGLSSLFLGVGWWFVLKGMEWQGKREFIVHRIPYLERDENEIDVQKVELVEHEWLTDAKRDVERDRGNDFRNSTKLHLQGHEKHTVSKLRLLAAEQFPIQTHRASEVGPRFDLGSKRRWSQISVLPAVEFDDILFTDRVKNFIQGLAAKPIKWWPLAEPKRPIAKGQRGVVWKCVR